MPPVLGPASPSYARLKSCAGASGSAASGSPLQTTSNESSGPARPSSITSVRPASPNASPERYDAHGVARVGERLGDDDALARGETVGLHHVGRGELLEVRERGVVLVDAEGAVACGGDPGLGERVLHPGLRPLEPRARGCRARSSGDHVPAPRRRRRRRAAPRARPPRGRRRGRRRAAPPGPDRPGRWGSRARSRRSRGCRARRTPPGPTANAAAPRPGRAPVRRIRRRGRAPQAARGRTTVWARSGPTPTKLMGTPTKSSM